MYRRFLLPSLAATCVVLIAVFSYIHRADLLILNPQGPVALQERSVMYITLLLSSVVVIPVFILLGVFAWKYRADRPHTDQDSLVADTDSASEVLWWAVPSIIILFLSIIAWQSSHQLDPYKPLESTQSPITVEVIALDWKWLFIYPKQGIATTNLVEFPENTPISFHVTADAPMNGFWIPSLGGQIMAMPGMSTQVSLMANATGTYNGLSSQISGEGFSGMTFTAQSVSKKDFDAWVKSVQSQSSPLTATTYAVLARPSKNVPVAYFSPVEGDPYSTVILKYMPMQSGDTMHMNMP